LVHILSQTNPVHITPSHLSKMIPRIYLSRDKICIFMSKYGTVRKFEINFAFQASPGILFSLQYNRTAPRAFHFDRQEAAAYARRETKKLSPSISTSLVRFVLETNRALNVDRRFQTSVLGRCSHADHAISISLHCACARGQLKSSKAETSRIDSPGQRS
jgi:hypothetical protein